MKHRCEVCGKEIDLFAEFWLREPHRFDAGGDVVTQSRPVCFCGFGCLFGYIGARLRRQKQK